MLTRMPFSSRRRIAAAAAVLMLVGGGGFAAWAAQPPREVVAPAADDDLPDDGLRRLTLARVGKTEIFVIFEPDVVEVQPPAR